MDSVSENDKRIPQCRLYVCKQYFGGGYTCIKFADKAEYLAWARENEKHEFHHMSSSFQPICTPHYMEAFDKSILYMRSKGMMIGYN